MQVVDRGEGSCPPPPPRFFHPHPSGPPAARSFPRGMAGCSAAAGSGLWGRATAEELGSAAGETAAAGLEEPGSTLGARAGSTEEGARGHAWRTLGARRRGPRGESGSAGGEARERAWAPRLRRHRPAAALPASLPTGSSGAPFRPHRLR